MTYLKFISMAFQRTMTYRVEYYTGLLNAILYIFIFTSVWRAVVPETGEVNGLSQLDMIAYAVYATLIKVSFGRNESLLGSRVRSGEIAVDLMKPFSIPIMYLSDLIGVSLFQLLARSIPILIISIFIFEISFPARLTTIGQFFVIYILAFILFFALSFLISSMAFFFVDIFPFWIFYFALVTLTSGAIVPLDFFPEAVAGFLKLTPFPFLFYYPTMIILERQLDYSLLELLGIYFIQIGLVLTLAIGNYRLGLRKLTIAGG